MRRGKLFTGWMMAFTAVIALAGFMMGGREVHAANFENETTGGIPSKNIHEQNYDWNWYHPVTSYLYQNEDGTYNRVEYADGVIYSETYSSDYIYLSQKKIELELPEFGGLYRTGDAWFVVEGQENTTAQAGVTEYRIIKYDRDWNKLISTDLPNANTARPFYAGSCRFAEKDGILYIRSCHEMYNGHQASVMLQVNMADCNVITANYDVANSAYGYISHSFNEYVTVKDGTLYACDHGDAYERGITVMRYDRLMEGNKSFSNRVTVVVAMPFKGAAGNNNTGATLGGFAVSDTHAIVVGSSIPQDEDSEGKIKNIFVATVPTGDFRAGSAAVNWITSYSQEETRTASNPQLVELNGGRYLVLWEEYVGSEFDKLYYVLLDATGKEVTGIRSIGAALSDCQPVVSEKSVVWYVANDSTPVFYQLPVDNEVSAAKKNTKFTKNGITYKVTKSSKTAGKVTVVGFNKKQMDKSVTLPNKVLYNGYYYSVTAIAAKAFRKCTRLTGIDIPTSVTSIGKQAFEGCTKLTIMKVGYKKYKTSNVGKNAFKGVPKKMVVIVPDNKLSAYRILFRKRGVKTGTKFYKQSAAWYYY